MMSFEQYLRWRGWTRQQWAALDEMMKESCRAEVADAEAFVLWAASPEAGGARRLRAEADRVRYAEEYARWRATMTDVEYEEYLDECVADEELRAEGD